MKYGLILPCGKSRSAPKGLWVQGAQEGGIKIPCFYDATVKKEGD